MIKPRKLLEFVKQIHLNHPVDLDSHQSSIIRAASELVKGMLNVGGDELLTTRPKIITDNNPSSLRAGLWPEN